MRRNMRLEEEINPQQQVRVKMNLRLLVGLDRSVGGGEPNNSPGLAWEFTGLS